MSAGRVLTAPGRDRAAHRPRPLDDQRPRLRRRHGGHDRGHPPVARGPAHPGHPGHARRRAVQPDAGGRERARTSCGRGTTPRPAGSTRSSSCSRAPCPTRRSTATGTGPALGDRPGDRAADHHQRVDRPARAAGGDRAGARHLRDLRRHPGDENNPTGAMGLRDYLGAELAIAVGPPGGEPARLPGPAGQHHRDAALPGAPDRGDDPADRARRAGTAGVALRAHRPRGLQPGRLRRPRRLRGPARATTAAAWSSSAARARSCGATCRPAAG